MNTMHHRQFGEPHQLTERQRTILHIVCTVAVLGVVLLALLTGCSSRDASAIEQAKSQAVTTNTPQQVQYVDSKGNTVTDVVQPPAAQGGKATVTRTVTPPAAGAPVPPSTNPVITPLGPNNTAVVSSSGKPVPNPQPVPVSITVPAGTGLSIRINERISVKTARAGDRFSGEFAEPVSENGSVLIPRGTPVSGRIDESHRRGHFKGRSVLELRLTAMTLNGSEYPIDTHDNVESKKGKGKRTAGFIGGMSGAGMLIGGLATGGVGLAIGGAAGAGAGTLLAGATGNRDITIPAESVVRFRLADDLVVQNP
jgi:hypothetical protein